MGHTLPLSLVKPSTEWINQQGYNLVMVSKTNIGTRLKVCTKIYKLSSRILTKGHKLVFNRIGSDEKNTFKIPLIKVWIPNKIQKFWKKSEEKFWFGVPFLGMIWDKKLLVKWIVSYVKASWEM